MSVDLKDIDIDVLPFLSTDARADLKFFAMQYFLGEHFKEILEYICCVEKKHDQRLSGTVAGRAFITSKTIYIERIISLACDNVSNVVKDAVACLINLAGDDTTSKLILNSANTAEFLDMVLSSVVEKGCLLADPLAMLLSNLSRTEEGAEKCAAILTSQDAPTTFDKLVQVMCLKDYNPNADLHFLASFLANLSQISSTRQYFMSKDTCVLQRLLNFTQHPSDVRRQGIVSILKNCCFDTAHHDWLLSDAVDVVPALLLPLAGPEEFDEEDTDKLPPDLQYLEPSKTREPVASIRKSLVEAITQLCATKAGRMYMKDKNVYIIIREYHKWEKEESNHPAIYNLVDLLIGEEPETGFSSNLKEIDVPHKYKTEFDDELQDLKQQQHTEPQT